MEQKNVLDSVDCIRKIEEKSLYAFEIGVEKKTPNDIVHNLTAKVDSVNLFHICSIYDLVALA